MEVRILPLGGMDFPKHRLVRCQDPEEMLFSPAWAVLIRHPTLDNVLYDTGHSPAFLQGEMQRVLYDYPVRGIVPIQKALAQEKARESADERREQREEELAAEGMEIVEIDQQTWEEMQEACQPVYENIRKQAGDELVDLYMGVE